jgi:cytochrome c oxidase subunit I
MSTTTEQAVRPVPQILVHEVHKPRQTRQWLDWVLTTDHKKIGIMYLVLTFVFFILGGVEALLMRSQLAVPNNTLISGEHYNELLTMHGTTMIFLFVVPVMAGFGNYFVPLMIGARDMAFPRLNALSFWLLLCGGIVFYASLFWHPPEAGWWSYPPLSSIQYSPSGGQDAWIFLIHLTGISSLVGAINFYVTIVNMRAPGMTWGRLPLFIWSILIYAVLLIIALPVVAAAVTMLLTDRHFGTHWFDPTNHGSPVLWENLFWFFGHPEVYIMILPGFGMISEVLPVYARKPIFGYKAIAASTIVIAFLSTLVWAHHLFTAPMPLVVLGFFMLSSFLIGIPTGVKIFNWTATLWRGSLVMSASMYYAIGFLIVFLIGGITGIFLAVFPVDWQLNDTYFVVAHFHYVLMGGAVFAILSGTYYWYPKMTGRLCDERLGKIAFWVTFFGFNMTFFVQHALGLSGMPRRIYTYQPDMGWSTYNLISTIGSYILGIGILMSMYNFVRSYKHGKIAGPDPWKGNTLEWFTSSPPPTNNFDVIPRVRSVEPMRDIRRQVERQTGYIPSYAGSEQFTRSSGASSGNAPAGTEPAHRS